MLGANAALELGPGGGNLIGAMRGARVVSNEIIHGLAKPTEPGARKARPEHPSFANM